MKINNKILSIPPYLSTGWENVSSLRLKQTDLLVQLTNGEEVTIPNLKPDTLEAIFNNHVAFLESQEHFQAPKNLNVLNPKPENVDSFKIGFGTSEGMNAAMHHNPELAESPDLPSEVLNKITAITKIMAPEDVAIPKAEPHCNCPFCQIARAVHASVHSPSSEENTQKEENLDEEVPVEELQFQEWEITQSGDKLFTVVNKLDSHEKYSVYLGHPVGCTCGKEGCEHILAVLKS